MCVIFFLITSTNRDHPDCPNSNSDTTKIKIFLQDSLKALSYRHPFLFIKIVIYRYRLKNKITLKINTLLYLMT